MAVRNWWIEAEMDGKSAHVSTGPRGKDGGFSMKVFQRVDGESVRAASILGRLDLDGTLQLTVFDEKGLVVHKFDSKR